ncbi:hypothetical protein R1flu_007425 [Riccia fluitans]|uniref:Reverse transcriptase domain-containing protein n=1 Tax=Riccia fluitans TaxID=41844 RepID=A0ABD1YZC6_9MARC
MEGTITTKSLEDAPTCVEPSLAQKSNKRKTRNSSPLSRTISPEDTKSRKQVPASLEEKESLKANPSTSTLSTSTRSPSIARCRPRSRSKMQAKGNKLEHRTAGSKQTPARAGGLCEIMNHNSLETQVPSRLLITSWNVRGLNDQLRKLKVKDFVKKEKPLILALQETKLTNNRMTIAATNIAPSYTMVASQGRNGGGTVLLLHPPIALKDSGKLSDGNLTRAQVDYQGFIQGRNMMDNILSFWLTNDNLTQQKRSDLFIKLDFEKAFDHVEHDFLWDTMSKLGLGDKFVRLVKGLTVGAQTMININGGFSPRFDVSQGVRQGCPLAPLLLAISTEPLMAMLKEAILLGRLKPLSFGNSAVADFSLFVDDMGIYMEVDRSSFCALRGILAYFESASRARLNLQKSSASVIGLHIDPPLWLRHLGCVIMEHKIVYRYLDAPIGSGLKHDQLISFCLNRMVSRLKLWRSKGENASAGLDSRMFGDRELPSSRSTWENSLRTLARLNGTIFLMRSLMDREPKEVDVLSGVATARRNFFSSGVPCTLMEVNLAPPGASQECHIRLEDAVARLALDKCILKWWEDKKSDESSFALKIVMELISHIPEGRFSSLHQKILQKQTATPEAHSASPPSMPERQPNTRPASEEELETGEIFPMAPSVSPPSKAQSVATSCPSQNNSKGLNKLNCPEEGPHKRQQEHGNTSTAYDTNRSAIPLAFYRRSGQGSGVTRSRTLASPRSGGVYNPTVKHTPSDASSHEAEPGEGVDCQPTLLKFTFSPNTNYSGKFTDAEERPEIDGIESISPAVRRYRRGRKGPSSEGEPPSISDYPHVAELAAGCSLANSPHGPMIRDQSSTDPHHTPDSMQKTEHTTGEIRIPTLGLPFTFNFTSLLLSVIPAHSTFSSQERTTSILRGHLSELDVPDNISAQRTEYYTGDARANPPANLRSFTISSTIANSPTRARPDAGKNKSLRTAISPPCPLSSDRELVSTPYCTHQTGRRAEVSRSAPPADLPAYPLTIIFNSRQDAGEIRPPAINNSPPSYSHENPPATEPNHTTGATHDLGLPGGNRNYLRGSPADFPFAIRLPSAIAPPPENPPPGRRLPKGAFDSSPQGNSAVAEELNRSYAFSQNSCRKTGEPLRTSPLIRFLASPQKF